MIPAYNPNNNIPKQIPGTIPAYIALKTAQYRKKRLTQNELIEE